MSAIKLPSELRRLTEAEMAEIRDTCQSWECTRRGARFRADGTCDNRGECIGYHCTACGEPCGMMGHECERARLLEQRGRS